MSHMDTALDIMADNFVDVDEQGLTTPNFESAIMWKDGFKSLSRDTQAILNVILDAQNDISETMTATYKHLRTKGFAMRKIQKGFREIKKYLREN
jgi:hypothetical protein